MAAVPVTEEQLGWLRGGPDGVQKWNEWRASAEVTVRVDLRQANLSGMNLFMANLAGVDLTMANLSGVNLFKANLRGVLLYGADLSAATLSGADLSGAILYEANLSGAILYEAKLSGANLSRANLNKAELAVAVLAGADLSWANLLDANLCAANLGGVSLEHAKLEGCDLRKSRDLRLDSNFTRRAQFSPVASRWWSLVVGQVLLRLHRKFRHRWLGRRTNYRPIHNDPWSVLRQIYAGPRTLFLFFFVVAFALPYVGRVALYSAESQAGAWAHDAWQRQKDRIRDEPGAVGLREAAAMEDFERWLRAHSTPRPVWQVLLRWDEGRIWPTVLAVVLIIYNFGVYYLVTSVGPLRDEEERSGWSPAWKDYGYLRWVHRGVTLLFYVSFLSFAVNMSELLGKTVWVPAG
jgi:hypothetical protein